MTTTTDRKTLKKMLASKDAVAWMAAADMLEERGDDASELRRRATLTLAVADAILAAQDALGERWMKGERNCVELVRVEGEIDLRVSGGGQVFDVCLTTFGPAVIHHRGGAVTLDDSRPCRQPVSRTIKVRRDLFRRPGYLTQRSAELADELIAPTFDHHLAALKALEVHRAASPHP